MGSTIVQVDNGKLIMDKRKSIDEIILKCVLENVDALFLYAVSPDFERLCRGFPTCLGSNADFQVFPGVVR